MLWWQPMHLVAEEALHPGVHVPRVVELDHLSELILRRHLALEQEGEGDQQNQGHDDGQHLPQAN